MKHRDCGGKIILVASEMYELVSPAINITTRGLAPGILELSAKKGGSFKLLCSSCGKVFFPREYDNEILYKCSFCGENHPPSELFVSDTISPICINCKDKKPEKKPLREQSVNDRLLIMYSEYIKNATLPTMLSILKKYQKGEI